jgi:hypothetical protein
MDYRSAKMRGVALRLAEAGNKDDAETILDALSWAQREREDNFCKGREDAFRMILEWANHRRSDDRASFSDLYSSVMRREKSE